MVAVDEFKTGNYLQMLRPAFSSTEQDLPPAEPCRGGTIAATHRIGITMNKLSVGIFFLITVSGCGSTPTYQSGYQSGDDVLCNFDYGGFIRPIGQLFSYFEAKELALSRSCEREGVCDWSEAKEELRYQLEIMVEEYVERAGGGVEIPVEFSRRVPNAAATFDQFGRKTITINLTWFLPYIQSGNQFNGNTALAIIAHEVGHHYYNHRSSSHRNELQADHFAGYMMASTRKSLDHALHGWRQFPRQGSATHPPRDMRIRAVCDGARSANTGPGPMQFLPGC